MAYPSDPVEVVVPGPAPLRAGQRTAQKGDEGHLHYNAQGYWVRCYHKCPSWLKILGVSAGLNLFWEFVTFWPIHHFYSYMGWIH